jgi:hypothetical protein
VPSLMPVPTLLRETSRRKVSSSSSVLSPKIGIATGSETSPAAKLSVPALVPSLHRAPVYRSPWPTGGSWCSQP